MQSKKAQTLNSYLVGGAIRDRLLGIENYDYDYVVVGSSPKEMHELGFKQVGNDFPVFIDPITQHEYALARRERKTGNGYQGFAFDFEPSVKLVDDLYRRDLTINAIAENNNGELIDPYDGQADLNNRVLRHISEHFIEDPLRVLRVARFAAKLKTFGFVIAPETFQLMKTIVDRGEIQYLTAERVWDETLKALKTDHPSIYFLSLKHCGALKILFPEIDRLFGLGQPRKWHPEIDVGVHAMQVIDASARLSNDPIVRFAALGHDFGKGTTAKSTLPSHSGHEKRSVDLLQDFYQRYPIPNQYKTVANRVAEFHGHIHRVEEMKPATIIKLLNKLKAWQQTDNFKRFLDACKADSRGRTGHEQDEFPQATVLREIVNVTKDIKLTESEYKNLSGQQIANELILKKAKYVNPIREKYAKQLALAK